MRVREEAGQIKSRFRLGGARWYQSADLVLDGVDLKLMMTGRKSLSGVKLSGNINKILLINQTYQGSTLHLRGRVHICVRMKHMRPAQ